MQEESCVIPHTIANEELVLSLLDRFIDVTNISFGALADKFYQHVPDELSDLKYHGRQVSFYMKRERPISPNHWHGIAEFVFSDEFVETLPEARAVIRQQDSAIEAGVYFSKLNGLIKKNYNERPFPEKYSGYWSGSSLLEFYIEDIKGYPFALFHGVSVQAPTIFSGFIFQTKKNVEELKQLNPGLKACSESNVYEVYIWDRLSRKKLNSEIYALFFNPENLTFVTALTFHPGDLIQDLEEDLEIPINDTDDFEKFYVSKIVKTKAKDWRAGTHTAFSFAGRNGEEALSYMENNFENPDGLRNQIQSFANFIDNNLWGVLGDGANS